MNERYTRAPHQNNENRSTSPNAALLIDFDNVTMGVRSNLGQELRNLLNSDVIRGKVSVQRAYADWRRYPQYVVPLSEASIDLIYAPAYGSSKKNATDIRLAIDALEVVFTRPEIGTFILLSGDSDFSSLVLKLKEYGKYVIGVGMQESSSELLVQNCDEYYSYDTLSGLVSADDVKTEKHDPWELVERAVTKMADRNDVMRSDRLKQVMLELDSSFDEKEIGFSKFNRFLTEASSRGILQLHRIGNGQYEVAPTDGAAGASGGGEQSGRSTGGGRRKSSRGGGRPQPKPPEPIAGADSLKDAYELLRDVVAELADPDTPVRDSEVKRRILERESDFDEATLGFSKFSRFLRQAHDEGVVTLVKGDEGNYYLQTVDEGASTEPPPADAGATGRQAEERRRESAPAPSRPDHGPEAGSREEPAGAGPAAEERDGAEEGPKAEEETDAGESAEAEETAGAREDGQTERPRRSVLGRRGRRGSGRPKKPSGGDSDPGGGAVVPGPSSEDQEEQEDEGQEDEAPLEPAASGAGGEGAAAPAGGSRRGGLGRYRRGRRGGGRGREGGSGAGRPTLENAVGATGADTTAATAEEGESAAGDESPAESPTSGPSAPVPDDLVSHMAENYPGVGERTARALIEEFGGRTLEVIDREPGRVRELLPRHRAEAVLEARSEERGDEEE